MKEKMKKMKKIILVLMVCCIATMSMNAQFVGKINAGTIMIPSNGSCFDFGGSFGFGRYVSEKERSYLLFDIGFYAGGGQNDIGTFSYQTYDEYDHISGPYDDGVIDRDHILVPILANYNLKLMLGDNFSFHIGPTVGEISVISSNSYHIGKKEWNPKSEFGEKAPSSTKFKALLVAGANIGLYFKPENKEDFMGIEYRCLYNNKTSLKYEIIKGPLHQISFSWFFF